MEVWLVIIGILILISFISWLANTVSKARKYDELKPRLDNLESQEADFREKQFKWEKKVKSDVEAINTLAGEKSQGFPWLAQAYADYFHLQDLKEAEYLERKSHPARRAAEKVREIASQRRVAEKLYRVLKYQLEYYQSLFPWLVEFKDEDIDDLIRKILEKKTGGDLEEPDDPAKIWLTSAEYQKLPRVEKYQVALDRYWKKRRENGKLEGTTSVISVIHTNGWDTMCTIKALLKDWKTWEGT